jgi:hypothetical protein
MIKLSLMLIASLLLCSIINTSKEKGKIYIVECRTSSIPVYSIGPPSPETIKLECKGD